jgi:hypothetical protein
MTQSIGSLVADLKLQSATFIRDLGRAQAAVARNTSMMQKSFASVERSVATGAKMLAGYVGVQALRQVAQFTNAAINNAAAIKEQAQAVGLAASDLQAYRIIGEQAGVSVEQLDRSTAIFVRTLGQAKQGLGPMVAGLKDTNPALLAALRGAESTEEAMQLMMTAMREAPNVFERNRIGALGFGRGAAFMALMVEEATQDSINRLKALGVVMDDEVLEKSDQIQDSMRDMQRAFQAGFTTGFSDAFVSGLTVTEERMGAIVKLGNMAGNVVGKFAEDLLAIGVALDNLEQGKTEEAFAPLLEFEKRSPLDRLKHDINEVAGFLAPRLSVAFQEWSKAGNDLLTVMGLVGREQRTAVTSLADTAMGALDWLDKLKEKAVETGRLNVQKSGLLDFLKTGWDIALGGLNRLINRFNFLATLRAAAGSIVDRLSDAAAQAGRLVGIGGVPEVPQATPSIPELKPVKPPTLQVFGSKADADAANESVQELSATLKLHAQVIDQVGSPQEKYNERLREIAAGNYTAVDAERLRTDALHQLSDAQLSLQESLGLDATPMQVYAQTTRDIATANLDAATAANANLSAQIALAQGYDSVLSSIGLTQSPLEQYKTRLMEISLVERMTGLSAAQSFGARVVAVSGFVNQFLGAAGAMTGALSQLFKDNKAFAIANAVVNTAEAITSALKNPPGPPFSYVYAAAAAVAGAAQIAAIASAQPGSTKIPSVKGGGGGKVKAVSSAGESKSGGGGKEAKVQQTVILNVTGDSFGPEHFKKIAEGLEGVIADGATFRMGR